MPGPQRHQDARCPVLCWWAGERNNKCVQRHFADKQRMPVISYGICETRLVMCSMHYGSARYISHAPVPMPAPLRAVTLLAVADPWMRLAGQRRLRRLGLARNALRALAHLAPQLPALAALDAAGCRLADEAELGRLAALPALASVCLADTPLSRKPVCALIMWEAGGLLDDVPVHAVSTK